ncbi:MAG: protease pro-enzyme activation domain-containing protein [Terracidiphilus sp.]
MINLEISRRMQQKVCGVAAACIMIAASLGAQKVNPRIATEIGNADHATIAGSLSPFAQPQFDIGRLPSGTRINGITIVFNRTAAQEADLKALIAAQQDPASPLYHQWLNPDQFAARFGMAESDLNVVESWLQQQGFSIDSVARSQNAIHFSGSAGQVEQAFQTEMHSYNVNGVRHFAPSTALSLPAAIAPAVLGIRNLDDFRPKSHIVINKNSRARKSFTGAGSTNANNENIFFAPGDIVTTYDIQPTYSSGYTGVGQSITLVGQSSILLSDITNFQNAAGLALKAPSQFLVPNSGTAAISDGDESESDLDIEWSGAIAPGASINFVYVGNNPNYGAFDSINYAIDQNIGTIISSSYGTCEAALGGSTLESSFEQATAQGQTVLAAQGDDGSTDCSGIGGLTNAQQIALAVDYPGSSQYVTSMGGTSISTTADNGDYLTVGDGYWEADSGTSDIVTSVLKYIPEIAWNDSAIDEQMGGGLAATGGGKSSLFTKPSWQTGVPNIPSDGQRDVPDLALYASPFYPGYLYCSSDSGPNGPWSEGQQSSCTAGFEDSSTGDFTAAGGTSFDAPIFAGMLALISQKAGYAAEQGEGQINPTLYKLASNATTYASAFHDITSGNNYCVGAGDCTGSDEGYVAGSGYDQVSGIGSVDLTNLADAWPANSTTPPTLIATTTSVTAANSSPLVNVADSFTISVTAASGTPTGNVSITVDANPATTATLTANGTYVYNATFTTAGAHTVLATYAGNSTYATSTASASVTVGVSSSGKGSIALASSPSTLTVSQGSQGTETITVTPSGGYTGTVDLTIDAGTSGDNALQNLCYEFTTQNSSFVGTVSISGTGAGSNQLILDTNAADCESDAAVRKTGMHSMRTLLHGATAKNTGENPTPSRAPFPLRAPFTVAFAGLLLTGFLGRHSRKLRGLAALIVLAAMGLALTACGSTNNGTITATDPPKGTYTITVTGQDEATATIQATSSFTFVIN